MLDHIRSDRWNLDDQVPMGAPNHHPAAGFRSGGMRQGGARSPLQRARSAAAPARRRDGPAEPNVCDHSIFAARAVETRAVAGGRLGGLEGVTVDPLVQTGEFRC